MIRSRFGRVAITTMSAVSILTATLLGSASAGTVVHPTVVSADPANFTPNLLADSSVAHPAAYALESANGTMYVGGQFAQVQNAARTTTYDRSNFMAFDTTTGTVSAAVAPSFNGAVWAIRASGTSLYVGGTFTAVDGVARQGLVKLNAATGAVDPSFQPPWTTGGVTDLQVVGGRLIAGGTFPKALLALDLTTGANTGFLNVGVAGTCQNNAACGQGANTGTSGRSNVYRFAVDSTGTRLVAIGNFVAPHPRAFMVDLTTGALTPWYYRNLAHECRASSVYPAYLRDVDFAPDGSYFVIASTGYIPTDGSRIGLDVCDAAARFETDINDPALPTWINYTGGDTLHSVVVTGAAVYVNGHNRWLDNPYGADTCLTTCVSRPGIGAINPTTGQALAWNPTKDRGVGGKDLLATSQGLWVASDTKKIGGEYHYGLALMPLS